MPRPLVIGNGSILVNFDGDLNMRDLFFPYVGQWNHIMGQRNSTGFWADGNFSWLWGEEWQKKLRYKKDTLVTDVRATNISMGLDIDINDAVHFRENIYLKKILVKNLLGREREVQVFFYHDFSIDETEVGDTAFFDPSLHAMYHYKKDRYFLINGYVLPGRWKFNQYATGTKRFKGAEGTWRDAEDGILSNNPIAQGSVDSTVGFELKIPAQGEVAVYYWIAAGRNMKEVRRLNSLVQEAGPENLIHKTERYWQTWLEPAGMDFGNLPPRVVDLYKRSLLIVRTHVDRGGAIVAATDSDILYTNRDHYCYMWPRDGALVAIHLIKAGYARTIKPFFDFCANALTEEGYLLHKYNPDGTLGSSWHPWVSNGVWQLPIQEDETALVLLALWEYYRYLGDLDIAVQYYHSLVVPIGDFLSGYIDPKLGLPAESYDLWEERRGIYTFTVAAVWAGLTAAARFSRLLGEDARAESYEAVAFKIRYGIEQNLFDSNLGRFIRGLTWDPAAGAFVKDETLESSLAGLFQFGVFPADDPRVVATMRAVEGGLWAATETGGIARYYNDYYFQKSQDLHNVPGNPWFICTLWVAQWHIALAREPHHLNRPLGLLQWASYNAMESGVLGEQVHPYTGEPVSVAPLTWSHAAFVQTVVDYLEKYRAIHGRPCPVEKE
ncbi:MAG: glycoside hydrolase family 15 protein [Firmicutes bacterium]|nr:glycoside hydrolase family 15 protein [Bacillota bacterium]